MIRVKPPGVPEKLPKAAEEELDRLTAKLHAGEAIASEDFKAYKTAGVREGLNAGFAFKCAYCESFFGATQPVAVEHYRPKAKVRTNEGDKPGYYWLAASWRNLLPSCTDCNSPREQEIAGVRTTMGKGNEFPIANEAKRARALHEEDNERRLLLHPYLDHPEKHLEFHEDGLVMARQTSGRTSPKGTQSIRVYALLRPKLVDARRLRATDIQGVMRVVEREALRLQQHPADAEQQAILDEEVARLRSFTTDEKPYAQMARQMIEPFLKRILG
jgi:uncharacterized protein (TIGR02646 family)